MAEPSEESRCAPSAKIGKLDSWSVHRICSGQVIVSLAVAVKELVENALDAGATDIIIRTKEYGAKLIEVQDNGVGIQQENFDALCRKHYTSKLQDFADLENILTFGFRGEALSSLCALGELSVTTKHKSSDVGTALKFDAEGLLTESKPCARSTGTTVTVENIFVSLPVRHKQFIGSLKKEFAKMVHFMSGYCLITREVAVSLINFDERGKRHDVLKKRANASYKDNIVEIFGSKETKKIVPYEQIPISEEIKQEFSLGNLAAEHLADVSIEGYVSNGEQGSGRSSADRQFIFVNSRPCDFVKLTRMINGVYHQFNSSQYPFVMLNIVTPRPLVDVNLTPDKRMLMLQRENVILAMVKASLSIMFQKQATKYSVNSISKISSFSHKVSESLELDGDSGEEQEENDDEDDEEEGGKQEKETRTRHAAMREKKIRASLPSADDQPAKPSFRERFSFKSDAARTSRTSKRSYTDALDAGEPKPKQRPEIPVLASFGFTRHLGKKPRSSEHTEQPGTSGMAQCNLSNLCPKQDHSKPVEIKKEPNSPIKSQEKADGTEEASDLDEEFDLSLQSDRDSPDLCRIPPKTETSYDRSENRDSSTSHRRRMSAGGTTTTSTHISTQADEDLDGVTLLRKRLGLIEKAEKRAEEDSDRGEIVLSEDGSEEPDGHSKRRKEEDDEEPDECDHEEPDEGDHEEPDEDGEKPDGEDDEEEDQSKDVLFVDEIQTRKVGVHTLNWTEEDMIRDFELLESGLSADDTDSSEAGRTISCRFRARISPKENQTAESELMREITKDMFKEMEIIGQFNKGFIVAKLNTDLFIVDQHAADEKFNFETLQATTVIDSQPLTIPLKLFLGPGDEQVVLEHLPIFEKNGFRLSCDDSAPCGRKLSLTAVPQSGQWAMGASEIGELVFMLNDNDHPNLMNCRPSKVRAMFAMRACRKSVMVGHELKPRDMKRVVSQLSGLQHPWNCPHGRPTMRHLVNLNLVHL